MTGAKADIDRQQREAFKRINGLSDAEVEQLSRYCRGEAEKPKA